MSDRGDGALGDDRRQLVEVDALVAAAGDEHDRRLEGPERGDDRVGLGALRVVDEADAVDDRDRLEAVLDAGEGRGRAADRVGRDAEQQPDGDRGQRVRDVVGAGDGQLADRHDPAARTRSAAMPPPASGSRSTPAATIQPSTTPSPPGIGRSRR